MTQIQAYEDMSKEALIEHHRHTLQQHADDMDILSKELASKSLTVPHGYRLVRLSDIDTAIQRAQVFDDGGDGADPESARSCIAILRSMIKTDRIAPVTAQEPTAWLDSGNLRAGSGNTSAFRVITAETKKGMPRGVAASFTTPLYAEPFAPARSEPVVMGNGDVAVGTITRGDDGTPGIIYLRLPEVREHNTDCSDIYPIGSAASDDSILACIYFGSSEVLQQTIDVLFDLQREHYPIAPVAAQEPLPPLNDDLIAILGRPNFMCAGIAQLLRDSGHEIKKRAENEQAAALHFLLGHYLSDPQNWNWKAEIALNPDKTTCTCPSGDGSLRWPCPVHPPEV